MKVIVSGSTGLIGRSLVPSLRDRGHEVVRLVRREPQSADEVRWDPALGEIDAAGLEGADVAFHLAGAGIGDKRWTESYKKEILDSRVLGTGLLASTLAALDSKPSVMVSGSAIAWYGDRGDEILDESAPQGDGFLADVDSLRDVERILTFLAGNAARGDLDAAMALLDESEQEAERYRARLAELQAAGHKVAMVSPWIESDPIETDLNVHLPPPQSERFVQLATVGR